MHCLLIGNILQRINLQAFVWVEVSNGLRKPLIQRWKARTSRVAGRLNEVSTGCMKYLKRRSDMDTRCHRKEEMAARS
jgi:hypothetical protein